MQQAQVLIYEGDGKLAERLRPLGKARGIQVRELRQPSACRDALTRGGVLVLKVGRDLERELALLQQAVWSFPDCRVVVVGDVDHPSLADLAWDLGAAFVLLPPSPLDLLIDVVDKLLPVPSEPSAIPGEPGASATRVSP